MGKRRVKSSDLLRLWVDGRKQSDAARELGVSQQTVSSLLRGVEPALPLKIVLRRVAGIPLDAWPTREILTESDLASPPGQERGAA